MTISASQFPEVYKSLGIDTQNLGCVMLDLETLDPLSQVEDGEDDLYFSPSRKFVQGVVSSHKAHTTLLYGLLSPASKISDLVDAVLDGWEKPKGVRIVDIGVFPGTDDDGTKYSCIVAHLRASDDLVEAHDRLRLLPHIDTFPEYKPHMTIAYVKPEATTEWLEQLSSWVGSVVKTSDLNYGE